MVLAALVLPATAFGQAASAPLAIFYHADLDGRFGAPACGRSGRGEISYAALAGALAVERQREVDTGNLPPLVLLGGNALGPDLIARTLLDRGAGGRAALTEILARPGYDAMALGHRELSAAPDELVALLRTLAARGVPAVASNLRCTGGRQPLCAATRPELLVRRGDQTIGIAATIAPAILRGLPAERSAGITLDDPSMVIPQVVRRLRQRGATRVVVMVQGPRGADTLGDIDALARRLSGDGRPDGLLAAGLWDEDDGRPLVTIRRENAVPIFGSSAGAAGFTRIALPARGQLADGDWLRAGAEPVDAEVERALAPATAAYCERYAKSAAPGPVRGVLTRDEFAAYVLEVMRRRAGAEVAVLNRAFVKRGPFPMGNGELSRADLHRALPYTGELRIATLPGGEVEKVVAPLLGRREAVVVGLSSGAGGVSVNGRPLDKVRGYRVATIAFVAAGGDGLLAPAAARWRDVPGKPELVAEVERFLAEETAAEDHDPSIDAKTDFGRPAVQRPLVVGLADLGFDLLNTSISNGAAYGDAQLVRAEQLSLKGDVNATAQLRLPVHEVDAHFNAKYGWVRSKPLNGRAASGETADLVFLTATYNYRGLRQRPSLPVPAIPDPYLRGRLESELTRPPVTATQLRDFRHFELTLTAGSLFTVATKLRLRAGAGVRNELLADGNAGRWRPMLEAGAVLEPIAVATFGTVVSRFEGMVDYNLVDPTRTREHQLRAGGKLSFPLLPLLFLTAGLDLFAVDRGGRGWGASYDTTVGLRVHLDAAHQSL